VSLTTQKIMEDLIYWQQANLRPHDASGVDNPSEWMWGKVQNMYYPVVRTTKYPVCLTWRKEDFGCTHQEMEQFFDDCCEQIIADIFDHYHTWKNNNGN